MKDTRQNIDLTIPFEDCTPDEMIARLKLLDHFYYNDEPAVTDAEYDYMYRYAQKAIPHHKYFTGIGADVRGGKVKLPYTMGSLNQIYEGEIEDWIKNNGLGTDDILITDKLDGTSAMVIYDENGDFQISFSRGNGIEGADTSRKTRIIPSIPKKVNGPLVVRGEMIFSKDNWKKVQSITTSSNGSTYKTARNAMAGIMNAEDTDERIVKYMDFIAYEIVGSDSTDTNKETMLKALSNEGFKIPHYSIVPGMELADDVLTIYLGERKEYTEYDIDGVVLDVNLAHKRAEMNPTRDTLNPSYSIKYKVMDADNYAETTVKYVEWNLSKHKYWKPRLVLEPVELVGVTVQHTTGYNAKYIVDNEIGPGTKIAISRNGDVVPNPVRVLESTGAQLPEGDWEWSETKVDIIALEESDEVVIEQIIDFFASIGAPHLREGNVIKLYDAGFMSTESIIRMSEKQLVGIIGENGKKIYAGLRDKLTNIPISTLMGSTNFFGRGVGKRRFRSLIKQIGERVLVADARDIISAEGFDEKSAYKIVGGLGPYLDWIVPLEDEDYITIDYSEWEDPAEASDSPIAGTNFCFTGFRSKELQAEIEKQGGDVKSSVSSKTNYVVTTTPNGNSGKLKKARELGIGIISPNDLEQILGLG